MKIVLHSSVSTYLQRLQDGVARGYTHWVAGTVPPKKLKALAEKFARFYRIDRTSLERTRDKAKGIGCARLVVFCPEPKVDATEVVPAAWVLQLTGPDLGKHPAHAVEKLRDCREIGGRLRHGHYELVRMTKPQQPKPVWTWRLTDKDDDAWRDRLLQLIRNHSDLDLRQSIHVLTRLPGFAGVRRQVKRHYQLIRSEWRRSRRAAEAMPELPPVIGYLRRKKDPARTLTVRA